ncbi:hypothetical protein ACHQM5_015964 [Ranunculus cassubicifolius]
MPVSVGEEIEKIVRRFLWGTTEGKKKYNLVKWDDLCAPMEVGGLGFRKILDFNVSLLSKWMWKYTQGSDQLWRRVIKEKFGEEPGGWFSHCNKGPIKYSLWRAILKVKDFFKYCSSFEVGRGDSIQFWHSNWLGGDQLKNQFPVLYSRSRNKDGFISDFVVAGEWNFNMCRRISDMEIEEISRLLQLLEPVKLGVGKDKLQWGPEGKLFSVKNCYKVICQARIEEFGLGLTNFSKLKVWRGKAPARVSFFIWLLFRKRILTDERLQEMGTNLASQCSFCKESEESMEHIFQQCSVTQEMLQSLTWGSGTNIRLLSIEDHIISWESERLTEIGKEYWEILPHAMFWGIWLARNSCRFEDGSIQGWRLI